MYSKGEIGRKKRGPRPQKHDLARLLKKGESIHPEAVFVNLFQARFGGDGAIKTRNNCTLSALLRIVAQIAVAAAPKRRTDVSFLTLGIPMKMTKLLRYTTLYALLAASLPASLTYAAHGVSIDGQLKYPKGFERFAYTAPEAKSGGTLVLHDLGSFEKMNPFTLKGSAPQGLTPYIFETLAVASMDEPFAEYGLIAEDIELAADKKSVTFTLNPKACFSDKTPITAEDVKFSLEVLKSEQAHPRYQLYFHDIERAEILGPRKIRFVFARPNRELHMVAAELPVLSKKFYATHPFNPEDGKGAMDIPVGSGPYIIIDVQPGKTITYTKNPEYWAKDVNVR